MRPMLPLRLPISAKGTNSFRIVGVVIVCLAVSSCAYFPRGGFFGIGTKGEVHYGDHKKWCVPGKLKRTLRRVAFKFGDVHVTSSHRSAERNRAVGGAASSLHLQCQAVDFRVAGGPSGVTAFLERQGSVGGIKYYPDRGIYHIDTGPRRSW